MVHVIFDMDGVIFDSEKSCGISAGIASTSPKQTVEKRISRSGLAGYFVGSIGGDAVKISKPDPEIYLLACDEFGFVPANTFAIEDSFNGIRAASAAGLRLIMVPDIVPADSEMKLLSEAVCQDLFEVVDYLAGLKLSPLCCGILDRITRYPFFSAYSG